MILKSKRIVITLVLASSFAIGSLLTLPAQGDDDGHDSRSLRIRSGDPQAEQWRSECSDCHIAYPPGLLPAESWVAIMSTLEQHFDVDASLDAETSAQIEAFLVAHASRSKRKRDNGTPEIRITETRWFRHEHDEISSRIWKRLDSKSNCEACHTGAVDGDFDEHRVRIPR